MEMQARAEGESIVYLPQERAGFYWLLHWEKISFVICGGGDGGGVTGDWDWSCVSDQKQQINPNCNEYHNLMNLLL